MKTIANLTEEQFSELMEHRYSSITEMLEDNSFIKDRYDEDELDKEELEEACIELDDDDDDDEDEDEGDE